MPTSWHVVQIGISETLDCILLTKYSHGRSPIVFRLPFDRLGRREEEEELFHYDVGRDELRDIIQQSNALAQGAKKVNSAEGRQDWWTERRALDDRMKTLLENIEKRWLGAFKVCRSIFRVIPAADSDPAVSSVQQSTMRNRRPGQFPRQRSENPKNKPVPKLQRCQGSRVR